MNFSVDATIFITLLVNAVFIVLGILIKNELHDIKSRIVRLEDKLMKSLAPIVFILSIFIPGYGYSLTEVDGGAVYAPGTTEILCQSPKFCPRIVAPDWSNNGVTMYGTDPTCRKSIDGGRNWLACTTQPSATNSNTSIAVARNGAVLWAGNDALGTVYNIRRSTNGSTSWATVYTTATISLSGNANTSLIKCAQTTNTCLAVYLSAANIVQVLTSTDNGATWVAGTNGVYNDSIQSFAISNDGTVAMVPVNAPAGTVTSILFSGGSWSRSTLNWATSAGGNCGTNYVALTLHRAICNDTSLGTNITTRDDEGVVLNTFNLSARSPGGATRLIANTINPSSSVVVMIGNNSSGITQIWISRDLGLTWTAEGTFTEQVSQPFDSFYLDNCAYFSYLASGLNGRLSKVCP